MTLLEKIKNLRWYNNPNSQKEILLDMVTLIGTGGSSAGSNASVSQAFTTSPTLTAFPLVLAQKQINAPTTITVNTTGAIAGVTPMAELVYQRLIKISK